MNWKAIKSIYCYVLKHNCKIEYLGEDEYTITAYHQNGQKHWISKYKNEMFCGSIAWFADGSRMEKTF